MNILKNSTGGTSTVQKRLYALHSEKGSWQSVAAHLGGKFDRGLLCRVAKGTQKAPASVRLALRPDYVEWRQKNMKKLLEIVQWALDDNATKAL